jgi:transcriptional regulator with XRE-family HTH domain
VTQVELAEAIGSSQRNISYYESEKGQTPALVLSKIAEALGVSTDEILGVRPTRKEEQGGDPAKSAAMEALSASR